MSIPVRITGKSAIIILLILVVLVIFFTSNSPTRFTSSSAWSRLTDLSTKRLQIKYPTTVCPLPSTALAEDDHQKIETCVNFYEKLATMSIDSGKMERDRVLMHKPWLSRNDSVMIEVGGYRGVDAQRLLDQGMHPKYIVLEPVPMFYKILEEKFQKNKKFLVLNFGLGREDKELTIPIQTDATSLFRQNLTNLKGAKTTKIQIRKATSFFDEVGVKNKNIDLLHINCEGCEFELLEDLISTGYIRYFNHVQFQFHMKLPFIQLESCRYCQIMRLLGRTHKPMFQYRHTWQAWEIKTQ